ncbi:cell division protein ZipA C-terminal FtsZ-binding domain-containing protein [Povalibacter sp.]|uniref:cell division protein ZipA C-terminal FtsZ-binding domain-containing protein n=1 Tax=Povalibacter sp. TaxID=1962978 RepID=UPI002F42FB28
MNDLRWILIVCGALLLIGIYFWGRRGSRRADTDDGVLHPRSDPQLEPSFDAPSYRVHDEDSLPEEELDAYEPPVEQPFVIRAPSRHEPAAWQPRNESAARVEPSGRGVRGARVEPTFGDDDSTSLPESTAYAEEVDPAKTVELSAKEPLDAPTLGMSSTPAPRRIERRKIIALRLAAPGQRFPGEALRDAMEAESLQFGRYDVFHRLHDDGVSIFSVASMMEPGTFELDRMAGQQYSGVTMFAQLPGPIPGVHALSDLVECGKRMQSKLGGTLQDDRGVPLTVHRIERLRQEVIDFERAQARDQRSLS